MAVLQKERLQWADIARGIGIFLVVLGHTYRDNAVRSWLYAFHMPLFFFLSGWMLGRKKAIAPAGYRAFAVKKFRAFMIPYALFLALSYVYWKIVEHHFRPFDMGPIWFLPVLMLAECIVAGAILLTGKHKGGFEVLFAALLALFAAVFSLHEGKAYAGMAAWGLRLLNGLIWYGLGYLVSKKEILEKIPSKIFAVVATGCFLLCTVLGRCNGPVDMYDNCFGNGWLYIAAATAGIAFCLLISMAIGKNKLLEYLGRYSLIIMCTHEQIKRMVIQVGSWITHIPTENLRNHILGGLCVVVVVCAIEVIVIEIFKWLNEATRGKKINILFEYMK